MIKNGLEPTQKKISAMSKKKFDWKMRPSCKGCIYHCPSTVTCDYMFITGKRRPCPAENCTVKQTGNHRRVSKKVKQMWNADVL